MSPMLVILTRAAEGFPRVSGDEPEVMGCPVLRS